MTPQLPAHLSEEALNDLLIGLSTPASEAHLAECEACRGQLEEFHAGLRVFNQASLAWSEARTAKSLRVVPLRQTRPAIFAPVGWALAALIFLMIGAPVWRHEHRPPLNAGAVPAVAPEDTEAQIAQDNDLLRSVNEALNDNEESSIRKYRLSDEPQPHRKARPESRIQ